MPTTPDRTRTRATHAASRRGSALLLVVGVLALMSIVAIVALALGRTDQRTGAAMSRQKGIERQIDQFREHVIGVIATDVTDTITTQIGLSLQRPLNNAVVREMTEIPQTDPKAVSNDPMRPFQVTGSQGYDSWLATILPTLTDPTVLPNATNPEGDLVDWRQISVLAQDGRFVNLYNIRNNFKAESGFGFDPAGNLRTSGRLIVLDPATGNPIVLPDAQAISPINTAFNQRGLARPAVDAVRRPGDFDYLDYSFADVDRDGLYDSRWFEMIDATDPTNPVVLIDNPEGLRLFYAARVVDLSGLVNVNTASDFVTGPTRDRPIGMTPGDVDLRRIITMRDVYDPSDFYTRGLGYNAWYTPDPNENTFSNYRPYDDVTAYRFGTIGYDLLTYYWENGVRLRPDQPVPYFQRTLTPAERARRFAVFTEGAEGIVFNGFDRAFYSPVFGIADTAELLTYAGANDPRVTSVLEATLDAGKPTGAPADGRGPMRSGRAFDFETLVDLNNDGLLDVSPNPGDPNAALTLITDIRRWLTSVSGARPINNPVDLRDPTTLVVEDLSLRAEELGFPIRDHLEEIEDLYLDWHQAGRPGDSDPRTDIEYYDLTTELWLQIADTLAPFADANLWTNNTPAASVLSYGNDVELAHRIAAHYAVNLMDAYDRDDEPSAMVFRASEASRINAPLRQNNIDYPFPSVPLMRTQAGYTANDRLRMAASTGATTADRVNVFGFERQPFLTEVMSVTFYTDAPYDVANADDEWQDFQDDLLIDPTASQGPRTVDGTRTLNNPDFLGRIVAFQLTNPFDTPIVLNRGYINNTHPQPDFDGDTRPDPVFYIEYAGKYFQLAPIETTGTGSIQLDTGMEPVTIDAGESRVFFATNPSSPELFARRWQDVANSSAHDDVSIPDTDTFFRDLIRHHFGALNVDAVHMAMFDPNTGLLEASDGREADLDGEDLVPLVTDAQRRSAYLWRVMRTDATSPSGGLEDTFGQRNNIRNDMLADRIRQPDAGAPVLFDLLDESAFPVDGQLAGNDTDADSSNDEGNAGVSVRVIGSIRRPNMPAGQSSPAGAIPPWCLETVADTTYALGSLNDQDIEPTNPGTAQNDANDWTEEDFKDFFDLVTGVNNRPTIASHPKDKTGNEIPVNASGTSFSRSAIEFHSRRPTGFSPLFMRPTDLLLVLGIGASSDPLGSTPPVGAYTSTEYTHTTISEALAMAMDYASPDPNTGYRRIYANIGSSRTYGALGRTDPLGLDRPVRKLDRGCLVLDDFVAFNDRNNNGVRDTGEESLAGGVPLALNMLSAFRVNDWGATDKSITGLINVNTAPINVLRTLPFLSPTPWLNDYVDWGTLSSTDFLVNKFRDGATTLINYRDRLALVPKAGLANTPSFAPNAPGDSRFRPGRPAQTQIHGVRDDMGIGSRGEILAIRRPDTGPFGSSYVGRSGLGDIDFLGSDDRALPVIEGLSPSVHQSSTSGGGTLRTVDALVDDYEEKLTVASALMNSVSVRSDVFAVWFMVHGYSPEDVEGLLDEDPLIPSVARRYLMIVDRSNVVSVSDKPRVLMFKEVPY